MDRRRLQMKPVWHGKQKAFRIRTNYQPKYYILTTESVSVDVKQTALIAWFMSELWHRETSPFVPVFICAVSATRSENFLLNEDFFDI